MLKWDCINQLKFQWEDSSLSPTYNLHTRELNDWQVRSMTCFTSKKLLSAFCTRTHNNTCFQELCEVQGVGNHSSRH